MDYHGLFSLALDSLSSHPAKERGQSKPSKCKSRISLMLAILIWLHYLQDPIQALSKVSKGLSLVSHSSPGLSLDTLALPSTTSMNPVIFTPLCFCMCVFYLESLRSPGISYYSLRFCRYATSLRMYSVTTPLIANHSELN